MNQLHHSSSRLATRLIIVFEMYTTVRPLNLKRYACAPAVNDTQTLVIVLQEGDAGGEASGEAATEGGEGAAADDKGDGDAKGDEKPKSRLRKRKAAPAPKKKTAAKKKKKEAAKSTYRLIAACYTRSEKL